MRSRDGAVSRDVELSLVVDGAARAVAIARDELRAVAGGLRASIPVPVGEATVDATLELHVDPAADAISILLSARPNAVEAGHTVALRAELPSEGQVVFVSGVGQIADRALVTGAAVLVDSEPHPIGIVSSAGLMAVEAMLDEPNGQGEPTRVTATSPCAPRPKTAASPTSASPSGRRAWRFGAPSSRAPA